jgi:hypothetical protein
MGIRTYVYVHVCVNMYVFVYVCKRLLFVHLKYMHVCVNMCVCEDCVFDAGSNPAKCVCACTYAKAYLEYYTGTHAHAHVCTHYEPEMM